MANKLIITILACAILLFANNSNGPVSNNSLDSTQAPSSLQKDIDSTEQKELKTKKDLAELIGMLERIYKLGDSSKGYVLGGIYSSEHVLEDGIVKADIPKALNYFNETLKSGYGLSAWQIVMLEHIPKKEHFKALETIEQGLSARFVDKQAKATLALTYGVIVLDNLNQNIKLVRKARDIIYPLATENNLASLDYTLANLLNLNDEIIEANKFLNSACNNPNASKEIINACFGGDQIATTDLKTGQIVQKELSTCGK